MRIKILFICLAVILIAFNYGIYQNEQIKKEGEIVFFQLAPVDPRSLIQGDYMRLAYAVAEESLEHERPKGSQSIVINTDKGSVAHFVRYHDGEALLAGERLLPFYGRSPIVIRPDSFLFQEGHAKHYELEAKYGVFRFDASGKYLLTGLADENRELIRISK